MAKYQVHYQGLEKRKTYDEVLGYLERGGGAGVERSLAFPNRTASFIRNSPQYQNLLTMDFIDLQKQQENLLKEQKRNIILREQATNTDMRTELSRDKETSSESLQQSESDLSSVTGHYNIGEDYEEEMDVQFDEKAEEEKKKNKKQHLWL